jgi:hypothetical protein
MAKVFPLQDMFVGGPNGGIRLQTHIGWRDNDPFVLEHPDLFTPIEDDPRDAEIARLKAELAKKVTK